MDGSTACVLRSDDARQYKADRLVGGSARPYYIGADSQHQLLELPADQDKAKAYPVLGPFGETKAGPGRGGRLARPAGGRRRAGGRPRTRGRLAHRRPAAGLSRAEEHREQPEGQAERPELGRPRRSVGGRPRPDGAPAGGAARTAPGRRSTWRCRSWPGASSRCGWPRTGCGSRCVVQQGPVARLQLGRIVRDGTEQHPRFAVTGLRTLTPPGENVTSVSWAGASRLVVLDMEQGGAQQIEYMSTDGSAGHGVAGREPGVDGGVVGGPDASRCSRRTTAGSTGCRRGTRTGSRSRRRAAARSTRAESARAAVPRRSRCRHGRPRCRPGPRRLRPHDPAELAFSELSTAHERVTGGGRRGARTVESCGAGGGRSPGWCSRWTARAAGARGRSCASGAMGCWAGRPRRGACVRRPSRRACRRSTRRAGTATRCGRWCWRTRSGVRWAWPVRWARRWRVRWRCRGGGAGGRRWAAAAGAGALVAAGGGPAGA